MFKKVLASVGIGGAKVDTLVLREHVQPGESLPVCVVVEGGAVAQSISGFNLVLMTRVKFETEDGEGFRNVELQRWKLDQVFEVQPGERKEFALDLSLHLETPLTQLHCARNQSRVWIQTGLEIDMAVDADDVDALNVVPTATMQACMDAMERCGLQMVKADVEAGTLSASNFQSSLGCYQELEYKPAGWLTSLQEVELSFVTQPGVTHLLIEIDRMLRGDSYVSLSLPDGISDSEIEQQLRGCLGL